MKLPKLSVSTAQSVIEGAVVGEWLSRHGVEQGRESTDIDVAKLAASGVDVHALAKAAEAAGHPGVVTFGLLQSLDARGKEDAGQTAARAAFSGAIQSLDRSTEAVRSATEDLDDIAKKMGKMDFKVFLERLGPDSPVMKAAKLIRQAAKDAGFVKGAPGLEIMWGSSQAERDSLWPAAAKLVGAIGELYEAFEKAGMAVQDLGLPGILNAQALGTVGTLVAQAHQELLGEASLFRSADELCAEMNAARRAEAADNVLEARQAFAEEYCRAKGWPGDPAQLSMDQIMEIRAQPGWKEPESRA